MRRILAVLLVVWCAQAQQDVKVTYRVSQASVQDVVKTLARQAGLGYNWQKSFNQTNPQCRKWIHNVRLDAVPFATAVQQILDPVALRYQVENGEVVLYRMPHGLPPDDVLDQRVSYSSGGNTVRSIVIDLANLVGLGYNWDKSFAQTDPDSRQWLDSFAIRNQPFDVAMAQILKPVGLRYRVEDGKVVLYRQ
jgi:hypothetical protein